MYKIFENYKRVKIRAFTFTFFSILSFNLQHYSILPFPSESFFEKLRNSEIIISQLFPWLENIFIVKHLSAATINNVFRNMLVSVSSFDLFGRVTEFHGLRKNNTPVLKLSNIDSIQNGMFFRKTILGNSVLATIRTPFFYILNHNDPTVGTPNATEDNKRMRYCFANTFTSRYPNKRRVCVIDVTNDNVESVFTVPSIYNATVLKNIHQISKPEVYRGLNISKITTLVGYPIFYFLYSDNQVLMIFGDEHHCKNGVFPLMCIAIFDSNSDCIFFKVAYLSLCTNCFNEKFDSTQYSAMERKMVKEVKKMADINSKINRKALFFLSHGKYDMKYMNYFSDPLLRGKKFSTLLNSINKKQRDQSILYMSEDEAISHTEETDYTVRGMIHLIREENPGSRNGYKVSTNSLFNLLFSKKQVVKNKILDEIKKMNNKSLE